MPDIAMCFSTTCSLRETCYRNPESGTKPSEWQTCFAPVKQGKYCEHYWENPKPMSKAEYYNLLADGI